MSGPDDVDDGGSPCAPRKLTEEESSNLRTALLEELLTSEADDAAREDATDLLDYAFAMIGNGKDVSYVVKELVDMGMDVCDKDTADRIGGRLGGFFRQMEPSEGAGVEEVVAGDGGSQGEEEGGEAE
eukprot:CAMPEP_0113561688 /NCGR_PEP_ID=MMETSP0015_2-20120614/20110_1 /TAXON_ID=2838 /ORGANISM="Odontella" /LENGTH=127 /DNA_ID=CAMNT_0000463501 /DNA_START=285 /DNA_END=665 /DNA_ORIENTATION=+ /assembly_acc=CAM_ASM_000160